MRHICFSMKYKYKLKKKCSESNHHLLKTEKLKYIDEKGKLGKSIF